MTRALEPIRKAEIITPFDALLLAGQLAQSSIDRYKLDFTQYAEYAGSALLDFATFAQWCTHLASNTRMSPNTINRMMSAVKRIMH